MTRARFSTIAIFAILILTMLISLLRLRAENKTAESVNGTTARAPVLVELFTSEGCSSCPPADVLLQKLDRTQPVPGADIVVLSEHVDYWNNGGWKDPYSARDFSTRQSDYARRFRLEGPYTPQMVVDGDAEFVGSNEHDALHAIENAVKSAKLPVSLSAIHLDGANAVSLHIEAGSPVAGKKPVAAQVWIALADDSDQSSVRHGENAGRNLTHVAVVRKLTKVGDLDRNGSFSGDAKLSADNATTKNLRVIAILQEKNTGRIFGVATGRLSD
jgi:hypothetical protein